MSPVLVVPAGPLRLGDPSGGSQEPKGVCAVVLAAGETANGADDNGDGRVDEGYITHTIGGGQAVQMVGDVLGLRFNSVPGGISVEVDIGVVDRDGHLFEKTFSRSAIFRNN
ncbi:MAG: hypothetical protein O7J95_15865 [Planctomycetota bacterium]|nr:hypothetical protein [Planctomycetota bacterium]